MVCFVRLAGIILRRFSTCRIKSIPQPVYQVHALVKHGENQWHGVFTTNEEDIMVLASREEKIGPMFQKQPSLNITATNGFEVFFENGLVMSGLFDSPCVDRITSDPQQVIIGCRCELVVSHLVCRLPGKSPRQFGG